jgi:DnaJ-class molecular chaperone
MAGPADLYAVLGVPEDADQDAIKKAFRDLAKKHHPDANPGDKKSEERFKEASQAYEILSDPEKRRRYDAMRRSPFNGRGSAEGGFGGDVFGGEGQSINDLFEMFFGGGGDPFGAGPFGGRGRRRPAKGPDLESEVWVEMEDAALGRSVTVSLEGGRPLRLNLPAGADDGLRLRLAGQGGQGPAGPGDLYLTLRVRPSARFRREGLDILSDLTLNLGQALLGGSRTIETLHGSVRLKIPAGSAPGTRLRIPGQGIEAEGRKGDHYVVLGVELPKDLDDAEKEQLRQMAKKRGWEL